MNKEEKILAEMVKSRECCRRAAKAFENARNGALNRNAPRSKGDLQCFFDANRAVTQMLVHLGNIPVGIASEIFSDDGKKYAARLITEIGDILEKTMIMEREIRETDMAYSSGGIQTQHSARAVRAYSD